MNKKNADRIIRNEEKSSKHINVISHYDDSTLIDKTGKLIKIIQLSGLNFVTNDKQTLDVYKIRLNNLLKNISSEFALYFWEVKRKVNFYPQGNFSNHYANEVDQKYKQQIENSPMFYKELSLAVITKHPEGVFNKWFSFAQHFLRSFDKQAKQSYLIKRHQELTELTEKILSSLADYGCRLLTTYEKNGIKYSQSLSFISRLLNFDTFSMPVTNENASILLSRKRLFFNRKAGAIEIRAADGSKKFAVMLSIKGYSPITYHSILDELNFLRCEYVITQSYRFYDRQTAKARLRDQQKEMLQTQEESITQTEQIDDSFDEAASGEVGFGQHHFTLACYADKQEILNKHISKIVAIFSHVDITCVREDIASEMAFWAQLPGNFSYICRAADISTRNMASFGSMHNLPIGKAAGNHWGNAVTILETNTGSPYYFNFHHKDVGNFLVFGAMGSGKTVLVAFLILQSMKFGGKRIIFDKDRGLEILVRAMVGVYDAIKPGNCTGFNPCQLEDNLENRQFLFHLFKKMVSVNGEALTDAENEVIVNAIDGMYRLGKASRQLCHMASFFGVKKSGTLRSRFDQWHGDGAHAWLFDNAIDNLNLDADVIGFDIGHILDNKECKTPALMYLIYRAQQALAGERGMIFIDEGWRALEDDYLQNLINNLSRTPRKLNNIFGLATQVANDTVNVCISKSINESAFCKIFFPNPHADKTIYIDHFGLSQGEYQQVKTLSDDEHYFLLVHGSGSNKESVVVRINLSQLEDVIAIMSANETTLALLDQIRSEVVGDDSMDWLSEFHLRRRVA